MRILRLRSFGEGRGRPDSICKKDHNYAFENRWLIFKSCQIAHTLPIRRGVFTGKFSRGCLRSSSPKISSQYLAILYCCGLLEDVQNNSGENVFIQKKKKSCVHCYEQFCTHLQWFSKDKITGNSEVTNAVSLMAWMTSCWRRRKKNNRSQNENGEKKKMNLPRDK